MMLRDRINRLELVVARFNRRWVDARQLEGLIIESGLIHDNVILMRGALARQFKMSDLQDLSLSDLCGLYVLMIKQGDAE